MKVTTQKFRELKGQRPIVSITAYDSITAQLADEAGVELLLVGDSLGNTILGFENTVPVTVDMMLHHTSAVARVKPQALLMADVPFGIAGRSVDFVTEVCTRFLQQGGAEAVKIEGGARRAETAAAVIRAGVPVMGHVGLKPQDVLQLGGYRKFGKSESERQRLIDDARAWIDAGAFGLLLEMVEPDVAQEITEFSEVPTIGIGSGVYCDGQILVISDLLGLNSGKYPGFVKKYADLRNVAIAALSKYTKDVRENKFPE